MASSKDLLLVLLVIGGFAGSLYYDLSVTLTGILIAGLIVYVIASYSGGSSTASASGSSGSFLSDFLPSFDGASNSSNIGPASGGEQQSEESRNNVSPSGETGSGYSRGNREQHSQGRANQTSSPTGNNNLSTASNSRNMADQVETTANEILGDLREEEKLDSKEEKELSDAENRLKDFLNRYKRDKEQIHALEKKMNGEISEADYLDVMAQARQGGSAQNAYKQLMQDFEKMKQDLEGIIQDLQDIEQMNKKEIQDAEEIESDAANKLEKHMNKLENAIKQLNS